MPRCDKPGSQSASRAALNPFLTGPKLDVRSYPEKRNAARAHRTHKGGETPGAREIRDTTRMLMGEVRAEQFMRVLAPDVRDSLSAEQERAIRAAAEKNPWDNHPVDLRFSLPTPFGRFYLALVGGRERRSAARRALDRNRFPAFTLGNLILLTVVFGAVGWLLFGS